MKHITEFQSVVEREVILHEYKCCCLDAKGVFLTYVIQVVYCEERYHRIQ